MLESHSSSLNRKELVSLDKGVKIVMFYKIDKHKPYMFLGNKMTHGTWKMQKIKK